MFSFVFPVSSIVRYRAIAIPSGHSSVGCWSVLWCVSVSVRRVGGWCFFPTPRAFLSPSTPGYGPVRSDRKYFVVPPHFLGCTRVPFSQNKRRKAYEDGSSRFLPRKPGTFPLRCLVCFRFRSIGGSKKAPAFIRFRRRRRGGYR